jgi:hypothetical protein
MDRHLIHPGSHQENGQVERMNLEVVRHLINMANDLNSKKDWIDYLPLVQRILNSSEHAKFKCTPAELLFANQINLDAKFLTKPRPKEVLPLAKWIDDFLTEHEKRLDDAQKVERARMTNQLKRPVGPLSKFKINDKVLVDWPTNELTGKQNKPDKLSTPKRGPYVVVKVNDNDTYECKHAYLNKNFVFRIHEIHPYISEDNNMDKRIAANDYTKLDNIEKTKELKLVKNSAKIPHSANK